MTKKMPLDDFRAVRMVLEPHEWFTGGENVVPSDQIDPEIWHGIVNLPDDGVPDDREQLRTLRGAGAESRFVCNYLKICSFFCAIFCSAIMNANRTVRSTKVPIAGTAKPQDKVPFPVARHGAIGYFRRLPVGCADDMLVPSCGPRMRCQQCGHLGADVLGASVLSRA